MPANTQQPAPDAERLSGVLRRMYQRCVDLALEEARAQGQNETGGPATVLPDIEQITKSLAIGEALEGEVNERPNTSPNPSKS